MNKTFSLLFYIKKYKLGKNGKAPIYLRITVDGERTELALKRDIEKSRWNEVTGYAKGTNSEARELNSYIDTIRNKVFENHRRLIDENKLVTAISLKNLLLGIEERKHSLLKIFQNHNDQMNVLVNKDYALGTMKRYETTYNHVRDFLQWKYNQQDIFLNKLDMVFLNDFEYYLKTEKNQQNNTAVKYIKNFRKIIKLALMNGWLQKDPFMHYRGKLKDIEREFLTEEELQIVANKSFDNQSLEIVRDVFLFSCYSGLAYCDVKKLTKNHISLGLDGDYWIFISRTKTNSKSKIPLLPVTQGLINKYKNHPKLKDRDLILPVITNQKMNSYLQVIADLCEIKKRIRTHTGRRTFATTIALSNNIPFETIAAMLGHKSLQYTSMYAQVRERKISADMKPLKEKLIQEEENYLFKVAN